MATVHFVACNRGARSPLVVGSLLALLAGTACGDPGYAPYEPDEPAEVFASSEAAVAACDGDDLQYDFNAFAASLAVAVANEMGRWDVGADFEVRNGKLELSSTGATRCGGECSNVEALLRLQDDASGQVPYHSPSIYRQKLTSWHQQQMGALGDLADDMVHVDKGTYRIRSRSSGKYLVPQYGGGWDGARVVQSDQFWGSNAERWRLVLNGTSHQLVNVASGRCLDLEWDNWQYVKMVQRSCNGNHTQNFRFAEVDEEVYAIRTTHQQALRVEGSATYNGASIVQEGFRGDWSSQQFIFEPVGSGRHVPIDEVATAVYSLRALHSGMAVGVDGASLDDGALVEARTYSADDDRYHWYISRVDDRYQLINRRSGKCLDLQNPGSSTSRLVQRDCTTAQSQRFYFTDTGDGHQVLYTIQGVAMAVEGASMGSDVPITQGDNTWATHQQFALEPLVAGEPHELEFSHSTSDGPCGDYYWYHISQPNGLPLDAPGDSFVQLIFAGGKTRANGQDDNPFIAQQVSGDMVAIDPSGYMNGDTSGTSGSCVRSDILYDATGAARGSCCIKYNGSYGSFTQSFWSATTFLCM